MKSALSYSRGCLLHNPYPGNPEVAERISKTFDYFKECGLLDSLLLLEPKPASEDDILRAHSTEHIEYIKGKSANGYDEDDYINPDAYVGPNTFSASLASAGSMICAVESVISGDADNCFSLNRPPGHHASTGPFGFCHFNNIAVAIKYAQDRLGINKVAVLDWDAHAGNGTMELFYNDPDVLTISIHQDPLSFFPGKGFIHEMGEGEGKGYCMNIPVSEGAGDADHIFALDEVVIPKITEFMPEMILVAAGQDSHASDYISELKITDAGFMNMTDKMLRLSKELCRGRLALSLEGGYNLDTLPETNASIMRILAGLEDAPKIDSEVLESTKKIISEVKAVFSSISQEKKDS
jgi:acetoin utilization deacetylase AcuC-like enzyme